MYTDKTQATWMALMHPSVSIRIHPWFNRLHIGRGGLGSLRSVSIRVHPWFNLRPPVVRMELQ